MSTQPEVREFDVCDVDDCENEAIQQFETREGSTIQRCAFHAIPSTEWATSWAVNYPKPVEDES